jgi:hypothetical protein
MSACRHAIWRRHAVVVVLVCCASSLVCVVGRADAAARRPYVIERFTLQTTIPREEQVPGSGGGYNVVNEPYAFTQAGGHPVALTFTAKFKTEEIIKRIVRSGGTTIEEVKEVVPAQDPKDIVTLLPAGLLGNPTAVPRCPLSVVFGEGSGCAAATQLGQIRLVLGGGSEVLGPIYNAVPEAGQSAEFPIHVQGVNFVLTARLVRTAEGYGVAVMDNGILPVGIDEVELTFWGVPAEARFDQLRGLKCSDTEVGIPLCNQFATGGGESAGIEPAPFLSMPTDCSVGPEVATMRTDSWETPGSVGVGGVYSSGFKSASWTMPGVTGCGLLRFAPEVELQPDSLLADAPVALAADVKVPQSLEPGASSTPQLRDAVVTLPEGMSISPGIVDGIQACDASGPEGINFTGPESEEVGLNGELQLAPGHCPNASTVGTAEAITPLLPEPLKGHVYLARPGCGGAGQAACTDQDALDGNLYQLYLELGGTGALGNAGVQIKVPGFTEANPVTGQITTKFLNDPQLPFSELKIHLNGGPRAPIDNLATCGPAATTSDLTPWSLPGITPQGVSVTGTPDGTSSSFFNVIGCADPVGLSPGFSAGTVSPQAGAFSAFTLNFTRQDREQFLSGIQVHTPAGLLGMLSSVPLCGEPQAQQGTCPEASKIGTTRVASGAGSHPFEIGGSVYLTTGYRGAPFGLSIATDAVAGPFNLGLVVVRARIDVDPETSELTVTSDPLPQIVFGVPLRLKQVTVNIDRPDFMFNPTSCNALAVTAAIPGDQNAVAHVASPFAAAGCGSLAFKPHFTVSTSGHTSKANGASLDAKLTYPPFKAGSEANIAYVKVELPKQLPSRLTTLQKACPDATFNADPAACPSASIIGIVRTTTPLLPVKLEGPVYFVSHGGEAFPSLVAVLQGDGVRVNLTGTTFISKAGITSSTFKTVPDVPVNSFEIYLPEGRYSALAANGSLCGAQGKLKMPSEFIAHNGARLRQTTPVAVTGCAKPKKTKAKSKKAKTARERRTGR